jgi:methyl-accepting chemotaxis protein
MSDFAIFSIAVIGTALTLSVIAYFILKKSFLHITAQSMIAVCATIAFLAYISAIYGLIHLLWAAPVAALGVLRVFYHLIKDVRDPIRHITDHLKSLSLGNMNISLNEALLKKKNEIGEINRTFEAYLKMISNVSIFASEIGHGNLNTSYELRSDEDTLGKSLINMRQNLSSGIEDAKRVVEEARINGNLNVRIDTKDKKGAWGELGYAINELLISFTLPLVELNSVFEKVSSGDLSKRYELTSAGDLERLKVNLNQALDNLSGVLIEVAENSTQIESSAFEMSSTSKEMSVNTTEIASSMTEMSTGAHSQLQKVDEVSGLFERLRESSQGMEEKAEAIHATAVTGAEESETGKKMSDEVVHSIQEITEYAKKANQSMEVLKSRSNEISRVLSVISEIASQTNLLALNAAIEAAQAGDAGRGFAVVAEEIRKLAEDSKKSAQEIEQLIIDVQTDTSEANQSISEMTSRIQVSEDRSKGATETFQKIFESSRHTLELSREILDSSKEQIAKINDVVHITENIVVIAEETAAGTEEVSTSAAELSSGMESFNQMIDSFKAIAGSMKASTDILILSKHHDAENMAQYETEVHV